jgi:hypothetical protein
MRSFHQDYSCSQSALRKHEPANQSHKKTNCLIGLLLRSTANPVLFFQYHFVEIVPDYNNLFYDTDRVLEVVVLQLRLSG